jgi:hypothetical protein
MFGYDPSELEKLRRPPGRLRAWVVAAQVLWFGLLASVAVPLDLLNHPDEILELVDEAFVGDFRVGFDDFVMLPVGDWYAPSSWRFLLSGLNLRPEDPKKPDWRAARILLSMPKPRRSGDRWVVHFDWLRVSGLEIHGHQQRPPPPWEPVDGIVTAITADVVEVQSTSFDVPDDPPIGAARLTGIRGVLREVVFRPGHREISAVGSVKVSEFTSGSIAVRDAVLDDVVLERSSLSFSGGFEYGRTHGRFQGEIKQFHIKAAVELKVQLGGADLGDVVNTATGNESPVDGDLDLQLVVYTGGDLPRGGALIVGDALMRNGRIRLGADTRFIVLDIIRIAPWVRLSPEREVMLEDVDGTIIFTRGTVTLKEFAYRAGKRTIRVDGTIGEELYMLVRLMPKEDAEPGRAGFGMVLFGTTGNPKFRLARREDMTKTDPWIAAPPEPDPTPPPARKRVRIPKARRPDKTE